MGLDIGTGSAYKVRDAHGVDLDKNRTDKRDDPQGGNAMAAKKATKRLKKAKRLEATKPLVQKIRE
jgi:hypothetical protein